MNVAAHPARAPVNILSLCAGVGGLEIGIGLALDWLGRTARGICYVEREVAAAASLEASMAAGWFHQAPIWADLLTFDGRPWCGLVHILASGDPCQDNSVAGKRAGECGDRFLAPEVCRIAAECRPDLIFRENVPGNADGQLAAIVPALEGLGYRVAAGIFRSSETGNTMQRERLFIMACAKGERCGEAWRNRQRSTPWVGFRHPALDGTFSDRRNSWRTADGQHDRIKPHPAGKLTEMARPGCAGTSKFRRISLPPAVIPAPDDNRGWIDLLDRWPELQPALSKEEAESHLRRGIDAMAHRVERLRATGNGVDPVAAGAAFLLLGARLGLWGSAHQAGELTVA